MQLYPYVNLVMVFALYLQTRQNLVLSCVDYCLRSSYGVNSTFS